MDARGEEAVVAEDVQVSAKPRWRTYTAEYKRRILKEADACTTPGAIGALLRREGFILVAPDGVAPGPGAGRPRGSGARPGRP